MRSFQIKLSAPELMAKARELTGVDHIIDSSIEEALQQMLYSFNNESLLHESGAASVQQHLLHLLCNRLRMLRDLKAHPAIRSQEIRRPVIITGGPRTGSTKLQKLLAAGGDFIYLPFWQGRCLGLRSGDRSEDPAPRIREADEYVRWISTHAPIAHSNHQYGTFEPEEDTILHEYSMSSMQTQVFGESPSYLAWWSAQSVHAQYEFIKQCLQYLQWQFYGGDDRPWLMKGPIYPGNEPVLADVFAGAKFVVTHRHPKDSVPSTANLVHGYRMSTSDTDWRTSLGPLFQEGLAVAQERHMAVRDSRNDLQFLDISFTELMRSPELVIEKVYAHADMRLTEQSRRAMLSWEEKGRGYKSGANAYETEDFSLSSEGIARRFSRYIERFGAIF